MINLNTFLRQNLLLKGFPNKSKHIFGIHKNQVGLMKLKGFSPLGVTISIYEKVNLHKTFFSSGTEHDWFCKETNSSFTSWSRDPYFKGH